MILDVIWPLLLSYDSYSFMMPHATIGLTRIFLAFQARDQDALAAGLDQEQPGIIQGPLGTKLGVLVDKEIKKVVLSSGDAEKERESNEASKTSGS